MNTKRKYKKNLYLLLELMIAFVLVALLALPLIEAPFALLKKEKDSVEEIRFHFHSEEALAEIKEQLYQNTISWNVIEKGIKSPVVLSQKLVRIGDPKSGLREYERTCRIKSCVIKEGKEQEKYAKVSLEILFTPPKKSKAKKTFPHTLFLTQKRGPLSIGSTNEEEKST